jgi:crotonobetainyl-CoA:carnitine CoA-transferase CaiB-like acyl-CoA transferase
VIAIPSALMHRSKTGEGQVVESSLLRSSAHLMNYFYGEYWTTGVVRKPMGTANHLSVPNQVFPTQDGSVVIIAPANEMWLRCARALDAEKLDRPQWRGLLDRQKHRAELIQAMTAVTSSMSSDEVIRRLGPVKVNVAKVNDIGQAADHSQLEAVGALTRFDFDGHPVKAVRSPFALHATPERPDLAPPALAAHTDEICRSIGMGDEEIAALRAAGAFDVPFAKSKGST